MSSTVNCPKCYKPVSIPAGVDPAAWVRCPLCLEQYQYQAVLDAMPPMLQVVASPSDAVIPLEEDESELEMTFEAADHPSFMAESADESTDEMQIAEPQFDGPQFDEASFDEAEEEATSISPAAFAAVTEEPRDEFAPAAAHAVMDLEEDEETLPAMAAGSLSPSEGGLPDYHQTHGFREAPADDEDSGVLELQAEENAWQAPPVAANEPPVGVKAPAVRRSKKSKRNPVFEIAKFVGGSVGGLAIGYAVLMWGFKQDPLKIAEILPSAIVPASLQPSYRQTAQNTPAPPPQNTNSKDPWAPPGGDSPTIGSTPDSNPMTDSPMGEPPMPDSPAPDSPMATEPTLDSDDGALPGVDSNPPMPPAGTPDNGTPAPMPMGETPSPMTTDTPMPTPSGTDMPPTPEPPVPSPEPITPSPEPPVPTPEPPMPDAKPTPEPMPEPMPEPTPEPTPMPSDTPMPTPFDSPTPEPEPAAPKDDSSKTTTMKPVPDEGFPPVPEPMPVPEEPRVGPKSNKQFTLEQVNQAMTAAGDGAKAFFSAPVDTPDRNKLLANYYKNFASLAESITLVNDKPENAKAARAAALTVLQSVATDMPRLNQIGKTAGFWKKRTDRTTDGIILAGRVQETTPVGKFFRTKLLMLGHDQPNEAEMIVVSAENPDIKHGEIAVVLGMIVGAPSINLHDYEGTDESIVWASAIGPVQIEPLAP